MRITDTAYITSVKDIAFRPALTPLEAAMLPAQMPRGMGALSHARYLEAERWRSLCVSGRKSASGKRGPLR